MQFVSLLKGKGRRLFAAGVFGKAAEQRRSSEEQQLKRLTASSTKAFAKSCETVVPEFPR